MLTKQTILIIGTEHFGKAMAARLANGDFHLLICDKEYSKAETLVKELTNTGKCCEAEAMQCSFDSAWEADIIILALPLPEQKAVAVLIKEVVNQKILVSTVDQAPEAIASLSSADCQLAALQYLLPNTKIVMVFNDGPGIGQAVSGQSGTGIMVAGNDEKAVEAISVILESVGINSIHIERLSASDHHRAL